MIKKQKTKKIKNNLEYKMVNHEDLKFNENNMFFFHLKQYIPEESLLFIGRDSIQKLVNEIKNKDFYKFFPLYINDDNVVIDGNRRLLSFRLAIGYKKYEKLSIKYEIQNFGSLKLQNNELPIIEYNKNDDLDILMRSNYLVNNQWNLGTSERYTRLHKMFKENIDYDYPDDINNVFKNVELFILAIENCDSDELKHKLEQAYKDKITMFIRLLSNTKLIFKKNEKSLNKILNIGINNDKKIIHNKNIPRAEFIEIILEMANYLSNNPIGQKKLDILEFKRSYKILKNIFNIKSTNLNKIFSKEKTNIEIKKISFYLQENLYKSFYDLKDLRMTIAGGWRERILIENIMWYLVAKSFKKKLKKDDWEFIENISINELDEKYRNLFLSLKTLPGLMQPLALNKLIQEFNSCFKKNEVFNEKNFFSMREQKFIRWINANYFNYSSNLNAASHGRWSMYDIEELSETTYSLIESLIEEFQNSWEESYNKNINLIDLSK